MADGWPHYTEVEPEEGLCARIVGCSVACELGGSSARCSGGSFRQGLSVQLEMRGPRSMLAEVGEDGGAVGATTRGGVEGPGGIGVWRCGGARGGGRLTTSVARVRDVAGSSTVNARVGDGVLVGRSGSSVEGVDAGPVLGVLTTDGWAREAELTGARCSGVRVNIGCDGCVHG